MHLIDSNIMARTQRTNHWCGHNSGDDEDKVKCAIADMLFRIGFSQAAAIFIINDGLASNEDFLNCFELKQEEQYIKNAKKPGGGANGHTVSTSAATYLKTAVWCVNHYMRISREFPWDKASKPWLRAYNHQMTTELQTKITADALKLDDVPGFKSDNPSKGFDAIETFLSTIRGPSGMPLIWVVRETLVPDAETEDDEDNYATIDEEMIARAPIIDETDEAYDSDDDIHEESNWEKFEENGPFTSMFLVDAKLVWMVLHKIFGPKTTWVHAKGTNKSKNGRRAYQILKNFLMGPDWASVTIKGLETRMRSTIYEQETKNFGIVRYTEKWREMLLLADDLESRGDYEGLSARTKVEKYLGNIKRQAVQHLVQALKVDPSGKYKEDFDKVAAYMVNTITNDDQLNYRPADKQSRRVAAMERNAEGGGSKGDAKAAKEKVRKEWFPNGTKTFIPSKDWQAMPEEEKAAVKQIREEMKAAKQSKNGKKMSEYKRKVAALEQSNKTLKADNAKLNEDLEEMSAITASSSASGGKKKTRWGDAAGNSGHPALARQSGKGNDSDSE